MLGRQLGGELFLDRETAGMKAVGYKKSLPIEDANSLIDFETAKPEPKGRDIRVAVKAISANPVDYKVRKRAAPPEGEQRSSATTPPGSSMRSGPTSHCSSRAMK